MNILIRLDISKNIGTGHFRRMTNLIKNSDFNYFFCIKTDDKSNPIFKNYKVFFLDEDNELEFINYLVKKLKIDIIILDLLFYDKNYIKNLKLKTQKQIVSFHEYKDFSEYSDLIINYNFFDNFEKYKELNKLCGPKYIIFDDMIKKYKEIKKSNFVFVSFGGADPSSLTEKLIENVVIHLENVLFKIHIGNFNNINISKYKQYKNIEFLINPLDLLKYMASAKLAISAAGNMMYELIYLNTPTLIIAHNKHQEEFALNAQKLNCIKYIGNKDKIDYNLLKDLVLRYYKIPFEVCKNIITTKGKEKIINAIEDLI